MILVLRFQMENILEKRQPKIFNSTSNEPRHVILGDGRGSVRTRAHASRIACLLRQFVRHKPNLCNRVSLEWRREEWQGSSYNHKILMLSQTYMRPATSRISKQLLAFTTRPCTTAISPLRSTQQPKPQTQIRAFVMASATTFYDFKPNDSMSTQYFE